MMLKNRGMPDVGVDVEAVCRGIERINRLMDNQNEKTLINYVNILGTEYRIEEHKVSEDEYLKENRLSGYCGEESKLIVVADMSEKEFFADINEKEQEIYRKKVLRHEIIHAFMNESGLSDSANQYSGAWCKNEEMIDWFAIQSPKIYKVFMEVGAI